MKKVMVLVLLVLVLFSCKKTSIEKEPLSIGLFKRETCKVDPPPSSFTGNPAGGGNVMMYEDDPYIRYTINTAPIIWLQFEDDIISDSWWLYYYNNGQTWETTSPNYSYDQKDSIVRMVAYALYDKTNYTEEFRNTVNITTDEADFDATTDYYKQKIVIDADRHYPSIFPYFYAGLAWRNSFWYTGDAVPAIVFSEAAYGDLSWLAKSMTHELGHTIGLPHQAEYGSTTECDQTAEYSVSGVGKIMGGNWYTNPGWYWYDDALRDDVCRVNDFDTLTKAFPWVPVPIQ